jgi:hypothetical protein
VRGVLLREFFVLLKQAVEQHVEFGGVEHLG